LLTLTHFLLLHKKQKTHHHNTTNRKEEMKLNDSNDVRFLMKQKLHEKKGKEELTGKERLQLLKALKDKPQTSQKAIQKGPQKEKLKFADNVEVQYFEDRNESEEDLPVLTSNKSDEKKPVVSFPAGFFDNPQEEKLIMHSFNSTIQTDNSKAADTLHSRNQPADDSDLSNFMEEINAITSSDTPTEPFAAHPPASSAEVSDAKTEAKEEEQMLAEETVPLAPSDEMYEQLVQNAYLTRLGLLYQKLDAVTSKDKDQESNNSKQQNIHQIENEINELQLFLEAQQDNDQLVEEERTTKKKVADNLGIEDIYFEKLQRRKHKMEEIEVPATKKLKSDESHNHHNSRSSQKHEEAEDDDENEDEDDDYENDGPYAYNPLAFLN
jgi:hypothetical protein